MRKLPIRVRLTLLYFVFFAAAGLLLSVTSWLTLRHSLQATAQHELEERADDVQAFLNAEAPAIQSQQLRDDLVREYGRKDEGKYLQIVDERGVVLYFSERKSLTQPLGLFSFTALALPFHDRPDTLQSIARPVLVRGKSYRIATAIAIRKSNALLWSFCKSLLILTPGLLLLAAFAGHLISRKALKPVAAITAAARAINDRNLSTRLAVSDTSDELSDLSATLNQMLGRMDTAFSSVRAFTANASHELRTPIALIRTRVEIALCFPRTVAQYQDALSDVRASAEHMTGLLDSLLQLARAEAGAEQLQREPLDLSALLRHVGDEWQDTAHRLKVNLTVDPCKLPVWVGGETISLRRLLHILIDNAFRHTPEQGSVDLWLTSTEETVILSVADTGSGISPIDLPHIFERFYRSEQSNGTSRTSERRTGAGLGLSLARWIAEQHGAKLNVESTPGGGATFSFVIAKTQCPLQGSGTTPAAMRVAASLAD